MFFLGENARPVLISALSSSVQQAINDDGLIAALLAVGASRSGVTAARKPTS